MPRILLLALGLLFPLLVGSQGGLLLDRNYELHVPSQATAGAIIELSRQVGVQVLMHGGNLDGYRSKELIGSMTLRRAFSELLPGGQFRVAQTDERTITIERISTPPQ